jgi:hypothetical protein
MTDPQEASDNVTQLANSDVRRERVRKAPSAGKASEARPPRQSRRPKLR